MFVHILRVTRNWLPYTVVYLAVLNVISALVQQAASCFVRETERCVKNGETCTLCMVKGSMEWSTRKVFGQMYAFTLGI